MKYPIVKTNSSFLVFLVLFFLFTCQLSYPQRIGYEWVRSIDAKWQQASIFDQENNLLIAGNGMIFKLNKKGEIIWQLSDTLQGINGITVDGKNNFYITGVNIKYEEVGQWDFKTISYVFTAKYTSNGAKLWVRKTNTQVILNDVGNSATSIACDNQDFIYISGSFKDTISFDSIHLNEEYSSGIFVAKYNTEGNVVWARKIAAIGTTNGLANGIGNEVIVNNNEHVYIIGSFRGIFDFGTDTLNSDSVGSIFLAKLNTEGDFLKSISMGSKKHDEGVRIVSGGNNGLALLAKFSDSLQINETLYIPVGSNNPLVIYMENDSIIYATPLGKSNGGDILSDINFDQFGNILYVGLVAFEEIEYSKPRLFRINQSGGIDWSYLIAESNSNYYAKCRTLCKDAEGGIYVTGDISFTSFFGDTVLVNNWDTVNDFKTFVGKIDTTKIYQNNGIGDEVQSEISVYPTFTNRFLKVELLSAGIETAEVELVDLTGRQVKSFQLNNRMNNIDLSGVSPGIYLVNLIGNTKNMAIKIVKH